MSSELTLTWPPRLIEVVRTHMACVEHPQYPSVPPLYTAKHNVYDFFVSHHSTLARAMQEKGFAPEVTECCIYFILGIIENSAGLSLLQVRERRVVSTATTQKEKRLLGNVRSTHGCKRRRMEDVEGAFGGARFARVLTLEYLLRVFVALPFILDHYDRLGGGATLSMARKPLWSFIEVTLTELDKFTELFYAPSEYVAVR